MNPPVPQRQTAVWWRSPSLGCLLLFVVAAYFCRATVLPVFGEETRRGLVAREMLESNDWIVPRVQGTPQLSRPPMQNWLIASASRLTGSVDVWAIRLPSLWMTLATAVLIFAYVWHRADEATAVLSAFSYLTMHEVLEYGRLGETEAVFTGFVAGSLLIWHLGMTAGWNPWVVWIVSYLLVAGGMLTKGMQAPLYFFGAVGISLLLERRLRDLLKLAHLAGLAAFVICVGAWQLAFISRLGAREGWLIHWLNISYRFTDRTNHSFVEHFLTFPLEVVGVMLPGSLLLIPALSPNVRRRLTMHQSTIRYLLISIGWAFVFVWIPPGSRARYFMPLMPLCAVLLGLVGSVWLSQPWRNWSPTARRRLVLGCGIAFAAVHAGPVLSFQSRLCDDIAGQVARLKAELPADAELISLAPLHHGFLYYYGEPIAHYPLPMHAGELPNAHRYFAIHTHDAEPPALPFAWEEIAVVSCDRYRRERPQVQIHIGERIREPMDMVGANVKR